MGAIHATSWERWSRSTGFDAASQIPVYAGLPFLAHRPVVGKDITIQSQRDLFLYRRFLRASLPSPAPDDRGFECRPQTVAVPVKLDLAKGRT